MASFVLEDFVFYDTRNVHGDRVAGVGTVIECRQYDDPENPGRRVEKYGIRTLDCTYVGAEAENLRPVRMTLVGPVLWPECRRIPVGNDDIHSRMARHAFAMARQIGKTQIGIDWGKR